VGIRERAIPYRVGEWQICLRARAEVSGGGPMRLNACDMAAVRRANIRADNRDIRLDLLRSLRIALSPKARERLLGEVRELSRAGEIPRATARELRALFGAPDYA